MRALPELKATFDSIDEWIDRQAGPPWDRRKLINQEAYFVLAWAQFEKEVDDRCRAFIRRRQSDTSWQNRRGFDIYNPEEKRLSGLTFDEKVKLMYEKSDDRAQVMKYYALRNPIAHGRVFASGIDVDDVVQDLYALSASMSRW